MIYIYLILETYLLNLSWYVEGLSRIDFFFWIIKFLFWEISYILRNMPSIFGFKADPFSTKKINNLKYFQRQHWWALKIENLITGASDCSVYDFLQGQN